jgi:hypothetical protein
MKTLLPDIDTVRLISGADTGRSIWQKGKPRIDLTGLGTAPIAENRLTLGERRRAVKHQDPLPCPRRETGIYALVRSRAQNVYCEFVQWHRLRMPLVETLTTRGNLGSFVRTSRAGVRTISRGTARTNDFNLSVVGDLTRRGKHHPLSESLPGIDQMPDKTRRGDRSKHQVISAHSGGYDRLRGDQYEPADPA